MFLVVFVGRKMVMDICYGNVLFTPFNTCANFFLSLLFSCHWIAVSGLVAYFGMVGCLDRCLGAYPVDFGGAWTPPDYWDAADRTVAVACTKLVFLVFCTSRCVARGVQENWIMWDLECFLLRPLASGCHLFERLPEEYRFACFREMTIQHSSWFNSGYMFGISLRGFLEEYHAFLREGMTLGS